MAIKYPTHHFPILEILSFLLKQAFNPHLEGLENAPNKTANTCKEHLLSVYYVLNTYVKALRVLTHYSSKSPMTQGTSIITTLPIRILKDRFAKLLNET